MAKRKLEDWRFRKDFSYKGLNFIIRSETGASAQWECACGKVGYSNSVGHMAGLEEIVRQAEIGAREHSDSCPLLRNPNA